MTKWAGFWIAAFVCITPALAQDDNYRSAQGSQQKLIAGIPVEQIAKFSDAYFQGALKQSGAPGALIEVVGANGEKWEQGYGRTRLDHVSKPDPKRSLYRIASETKFFTALGIMTLAEQGRLKLDDNIEIWLGDLRLKPQLPDPIRIKDLLQHTAGISNIPMVGAALNDPAQHIGLEQYLRDSAPTRLRAPGETYAYTNGAFTLLGRILETASGQSYEQFMRDHILVPLEMPQATFAVNKALMPKLMMGHVVGDGTIEPLLIRDTRTRPSGDLITTAHEMGSFLSMMLHDGSAGETQFLRPETLHRIYSDCYRAQPLQSRSHCLGLGREDRNGITIYSHSGDHISYRSAWWIVPEKGFAIWVGYNANASPAPNYLDAFLKRFFPGNYSYPAYMPASAGDVSAYVGYYRPNSSSMSRSGKFFDILPGENDLLVRLGPQGDIWVGDSAYSPIGSRTFVAAKPEKGTERYTIATFQQSADSKQRYLQTEGGSWTKVPWYMRATINRWFAAMCLTAIFALASISWLLPGNTIALSQKTLMMVSSTFLVAAAILIAPVGQSDFHIVWAFPTSFVIARWVLDAGFLLAAALFVLTAFVPTDRPLARTVPHLYSAVCLALALWSGYWGFLL